MRAHGGFALLAGSGLYVALYAARVFMSGGLAYDFMLWNLTLAWVPWLAAQSSRVAAERGRSTAAWILGFAWLVFLPNAPYVVTDFVHLRPRAGAPLWYDAALLGTAALVGLAAGGLSLRAMHAWVAARHGAVAGAVLLAASALATGLGIYLGRFERWNSWDLVLRPNAVLEDVLALVREPHPTPIVVTLVFAALTTVAYLVVGGRVIADATPRRERSTPRPTR
jgi:uncharacterized membrane protein